MATAVPELIQLLVWPAGIIIHSMPHLSYAMPKYEAQDEFFLQFTSCENSSSANHAPFHFTTPPNIFFSQATSLSGWWFKILSWTEVNQELCKAPWQDLEQDQAPENIQQRPNLIIESWSFII